MIDFSSRSDETEWMDTEVVSDADFARCLADLAVVNTVTLARPPTVAFMRRVARGLPAGTRLSVLDVGFGQGDMLRRVARWGARRGLALELAGIDLNPASAAAARAATPPGLAINFRTGNVFDEPPGRYDVVLCSLLTHHLSDPQLLQFLAWLEASASRAWFINDLHRHPIAYYGFAAMARVAGWHRFVQHDGPVSVARSFRRQDWQRVLAGCGLDGVAQVRWHVPFRYCVSRLH